MPLPANTTMPKRILSCQVYDLLLVLVVRVQSEEIDPVKVDYSYEYFRTGTLILTG